MIRVQLDLKTPLTVQLKGKSLELCNLIISIISTCLAKVVGEVPRGNGRFISSIRILGTRPCVFLFVGAYLIA